MRIKVGGPEAPATARLHNTTVGPFDYYKVRQTKVGGRCWVGIDALFERKAGTCTACLKSESRVSKELYDKVPSIGWRIVTLTE